MSYEKTFKSFANALQNEQMIVGSVACQPSKLVLDKKDHFPVFTEAQAQSSMTRVMQLADAPSWYSGGIGELRKEVYAGILKIHPSIQLNIKVPAEFIVALSDGQTPADTKTVKDPNTVQESEVPQVKRPTLTSAAAHEAFKDAEVRKAFAGRLMQILDEETKRLDSARQIAGRLLQSGLTSQEFDMLSTYIQSDVLYELMNKGTCASTEARRKELLEKLKK